MLRLPRDAVLGVLGVCCSICALGVLGVGYSILEWKRQLGFSWLSSQKQRAVNGAEVFPPVPHGMWDRVRLAQEKPRLGFEHFRAVRQSQSGTSAPVPFLECLISDESVPVVWH